MRKNDNFILKEIGDNCILIPFGGETSSLNGIIQLNETAKFMWENIEGDFTTDSLTELLIKEYNVTKEEAAESAELFISQMKEVGGIEE